MMEDEVDVVEMTRQVSHPGKFFVKQIERQCPSALSDCKLKPCFSRFQFTKVWIQGVVTSVHPASQTFTLDDGTGVLVVNYATFVSKIDPQALSSIRQGRVLVVVGPTSKKRNEIVIVAHKLVDVSDDPNCETTWIADVLCVQKRLSRD
eukprot:TRINITY_DN1259_c0_g1_i1.p2 TRINITY_DN1259_c0_g1~~TRINITY_DN1259_c0_g1_i1.p2  ORF type:complete len:149 (-),score=64.71 TRINITY_DN1259_c0_g1_i1:72-518(-)